MAGKHHEADRVCYCDRADANCVGLAVRRLSQERVRELAEEIWTTSTGSVLPARTTMDPRSSRAGASAQAAYRRRRQQELEAWRPGLRWRAWTVFGAAVGGLLIGLAIGFSLGWPMALTLALLTGWRLRFRPSASVRVWRRQAAMQRCTAGILQPLEQEGYLVLHDITLPGWPAGLDHVVVGPTGVWVIASRQRGRLALLRKTARACRAPSGSLRGLRWQSAAIADVLAGDTSISVQPLLCIHGGSWPGSPQSVEGIPVAAMRRLADVVRRGSSIQPSEVDRATTRALEVLRPAA